MTLSKDGRAQSATWGIVYARRPEGEFRARNAVRKMRRPSDELRMRVLQSYSHICAYCQRKATTVDHVVPTSRGGTNAEGNLVACCYGCNEAKANKPLLVFRLGSEGGSGPLRS